MSLLLDALKKAAEQKKKQAGAANSDTSFTAGDTIASDETQTVFSESDPTIVPGSDEDETMSLLTTDDVSDFLDDSETQADEHKTEEMSEDLSLYLVDQKSADDTTTPAPHTLDTNQQMLASQTADTEGSELAGHQQHQPEQTSTKTADQTESMVTASIELESLRNENTIIRRDATSTNTYAPDNYDRTLIRPAAEDASKFFAGMKAEESVLMTPDYAKRVFLSKSSASKSQFYKLYAGIGIIIMLAISIYAVIELEDEITQIDNTLARLKRDPMPGLIKNPDTEKGTDLFEDSAAMDVDSKTLKLVEGALLEIVTADIDAGADPLQVMSEASVPEDVSTNAEDSQVIEIAQLVKQDKPKTSSQSSSGSLQITTASRPDEKYQLLADAYRAYQSGDDEIALQKYNRVLALEPNNRNALLARAAIAIQNADIESAINDYRSLLMANPKDSLAMSSLISVANISPQQSETQLKLLIRDEPESPYLNFVLANVYGSQNRWQEAQGHYFKALEITPDNPNYAYNLAISLEHIAKPKVAIAYYEKALVNFENGLATFNKDVVGRRIETLRRL
ncbi:MAG: tetratricopeptide repeat protein [Gammaproteobacteria bacterium]|nr:tetratricopeptide repeat protein [Gammaproteobacteria bacterium]